MVVVVPIPLAFSDARGGDPWLERATERQADVMMVDRTDDGQQR